MSRRRSKRTQQVDMRSLIATLIGAAVVAIAALLGFNLSDLGNETATSVPTLATTPPPAATQIVNPPTGTVTVIPVAQGFGAQRDFWQVYFTAPTGSRDAATYVGGIDVPLANAIDRVQRTLDIAAFEWNSRVLTDAVIAAQRRGVRVRMVVDNEHAMEDDDSTIGEVIAAGVPVIDDARSALMHNKFMILDGEVVWTGSTNYTVNDVYRNNNNMLVLRSQRAVEAYQAEFNLMFEQRQFTRARSGPNTTPTRFTLNDVSVLIFFSPRHEIISTLLNLIEDAQSSVRFMAFSFTVDEMAQALLQRSRAGVRVEGIFELRGSETEFSELRPLFCAGLNMRQDGNPFTFHHKVFIIDDRTVVTGSFNFSANAQSNSENLVIIHDPTLAALYIEEFNRVQAQAAVPRNIACN